MLIRYVGSAPKNYRSPINGVTPREERELPDDLAQILLDQGDWEAVAPGTPVATPAKEE